MDRKLALITLELNRGLVEKNVEKIFDHLAQYLNAHSLEVKLKDLQKLQTKNL